MKCIIAEKPSVAREIAHIVGAKKQEQGYLVGNDYYVTWAIGHLVSPALPESYGISGFRKENLPIIPEEFTLVPRQVKTPKGYKDDKDIVAHIKIIADLFEKSETIIVATDAGREGELIFRYLYSYIGGNTPFQRLWINSLTDKAIRKGMKELKHGSHYDNLYQAAKARSEADWLVGINATQAISVAAGRGMYSLGRVQTPTLAIICERFWDNHCFVSEDVHQLHFATKANNMEDGIIKFDSIEKWKEKAEVEELYNLLNPNSEAVITKFTGKDKTEETPLLYDLTELQKEANKKHGFSADKTLSLAQKLYEAKLITYPRTGSRYIPQDVFGEVHKLLLSLKTNYMWGRLVGKIGKPSKRSVDDAKVTDHHALLITGIEPENLTSEETTIYNMIIGRMLEAFSSPCQKYITEVEAEVNDVKFKTKGVIIKEKGWRNIYSEDVEDKIIPQWSEGEKLPLAGFSFTSGKTQPKALHTEASLLSVMETAGKNIEDETLRESIKDCGIGTPATRASIIETLFKREYITRQKKKLVPTEKGLALYSIVKNMTLSNVELTGEWEKELIKIEKGELDSTTFRKNIEQYASNITKELLSCDKLFNHKKSEYICPKCKKGKMQFYEKVVKCDNEQCELPIFRLKAGKTLSDDQIKDLLEKGETGFIKGFKSRNSKRFEAKIAFGHDFKTNFIFFNVKGTKK